MLAFFLIQLLPLPLLLWLAITPLKSPILRAAQALATVAVFLAIALVGVWPAWWLPHLYWTLLVIALIFGLRRPIRPTGALGRAAGVGLVAIGAFGLFISAQAIRGRDPPPGPVADLSSPLRGENFQVVHGGFGLLINPHMRTLARATDRQRQYYGQSYALDIVAHGPLGFIANGIEPRDPRRWAIFGAAVHAPCSGIAVQAIDGLRDMPVPEMDSEHMVGNHVLLRCGKVDVLLAHMASGSVAVTSGKLVQEGQFLGRVGNSGNSSAPHLHIHAQRPGPPEAPFSGVPLPMRFEGKFLARGDRL
jgi:hypothetical protein